MIWRTDYQKGSWAPPCAVFRLYNGWGHMYTCRLHCTIYIVHIHLQMHTDWLQYVICGKTVSDVYDQGAPVSETESALELFWGFKRNFPIQCFQIFSLGSHQFFALFRFKFLFLILERIDCLEKGVVKRRWTCVQE